MNKDQIVGYWLQFKKKNDQLINEETLLSGFKLIISYLLFRKILHQNSSKIINQELIIDQIEVLHTFNEVFCFSKYQIEYQNQIITISAVDSKNSTEQEIIKLSADILQDLWNYMSGLDFTSDTTLIDFYSLNANITIASESLNKSRGIFYTPMNISKKMTQEAISKFLAKKDVEEIKILDSSCGIGNFLVPAFDVLLDIWKKSTSTPEHIDYSVLTILQNQLIGYDTDELGVIICKLRLLQKVLASISSLEVTTVKLKNVFENIKPHDFLTEGQTIQPNIILGNPPWGQIKDSEYRKEMMKEYEYHKGQVDAYRLFLEKCIKLDPTILCVLTPDSWLEIPGAMVLKDKFFKNYYFTSLFLLPKETFPISTHFFGFVAEKNKSSVISEVEVTVVKYEEQEQSFRALHKKILVEEMLDSSFLRNLVLEKDFKELNTKLQESNDIIKLGSLIEVTIGYQLYHNSIHTPEEIANKVYHSKIKKGPEWVPQITSKNLHRFYIDFTSTSYVKRTAQFFRIPAEKFIISHKLLIREILAKDGLVVAKTDRNILFPKTVLSVLLQENNTDKRLLQLLGYFMSYICQFDLLLHGVKSSRGLFPRISIQSLKNLNIHRKLFETDLDEIVQLIITSSEKKEEDQANFLKEQMALLQAKIFLVWEFNETQATVIMNYLQIPITVQNEVIDKILKKFEM